MLTTLGAEEGAPHRASSLFAPVLGLRPASEEAHQEEPLIGSLTEKNLEIANFSIAVAGPVATGALTMVAVKLATWPGQRP
jgi:hypothetical protein